MDPAQKLRTDLVTELWPSPNFEEAIANGWIQDSPLIEVYAGRCEQGLAESSNEQEIAAGAGKIIAMNHGIGNRDHADEVMDRFYRYGTSRYFGQLVKNARARTEAAMTYTELERAEDLHEEIHAFRTWNVRRQKHAKPTEASGIEFALRTSTVLDDSDIFTPITKALCRIEGPDIALEYIAAHRSFSVMTPLVALLGLAEVLQQKHMVLPQNVQMEARKALDTVRGQNAITMKLEAALRSQQPQQENTRKLLPLLPSI